MNSLPRYTHLLKHLSLALVFFLVSCGDDYIPKPNAYLRLEYPEAEYNTPKFDLPFTFQTNALATKITKQAIGGTTETYAVNINYPALKGTIFLTYKAIESDKKNLNDFLRDAQKFTLEHTIKADEIPKYPFESKETKVYGMLSEVRGNAASPAQFYVTDSVNHFLTGSVYFKAKPNYDSLYPAAQYLQNDLRRMMETLKWKGKG